MNQVLTAAEAAKKLGINYNTFLYHVKKGRFTHSTIGWSKVFDLATLKKEGEAFKQSRRAGNDAPN